VTGWRTVRDVPGAAGVVSGDETTRMMCAAVHRREQLADAVVRSYLVEEVGAVPPSPGLDAAAVLRDAAAAQHRRFLRDVLVLVLLVLLVLLAPVAVAVWAAAAAVVQWRVKPAIRTHGRTAAVAGVLGVLALIGAVQAVPFTHLLLPSAGGWPAVTVAALVFVVLAAERYVGSRWLRRRFHPQRFVADPRPGPGLERWLRTCGTRRFAAQLNRVASADERAEASRDLVDVIVHRSPTPFVGAGFSVATEPVVVPAKNRRSAKPIEIADLHEHVARRLEGETVGGGPLLYRRQVVVAANRLVSMVRAGGSPFATRVFGDLRKPPERHLPAADVAAVVDDRVEGVRFYSCFRSESATRDLVVSCYLRITAELGQIQLQLTPCLLPPMHRLLDEVDRTVRIGRGWLNGAAVDFVALPLQVHRRLDAVLRRPTPRRPRSRRKIEPERYGADRSLRESVSRGIDADEQWYQVGDADVRVAALCRRLFDEIANYLRKRGYDVSQLRKDAAAAVSNTTIKITGGKFADVNIAGRDVLQTKGEKADEKDEEKAKA
jgi:hypothetical protein